MLFISKFFQTRTLLISVIVFILLSTVASASELDDNRQELQDVQAQIQANGSQQSDLDKQEAEILKQIQENDQKIAQFQAKISNLQDELNKTISNRQAAETKLNDLQKGLDTAQTKLASDQEELAKRRAVFNERLVSVYKSSSPQIVAVLINAQNFSDFIKRAVFIGQIAENDARLVSGIKHLVDVTQEKIAQINTEKKSVNEQRLYLVNEENRITMVKSQIADTQKQFQDEVNTQQQLLAQTQQEKNQLKQAENMLVASSQEITNQIKELEAQQTGANNTAREDGGNPTPAASNPSSKSPGIPPSKRFIYPAYAPISSGYGWRYHPILGYSRLHAGVDFAVDTGTPVHATASGTVIIAGWYGGYGYAVVIDHGGGFTSLYGHNSSLAVSVGSQVSQGQVISHSGSTGLSTGPHLHFEIRVNGEAQDPMKWL